MTLEEIIAQNNAAAEREIEEKRAQKIADESAPPKPDWRKDAEMDFLRLCAVRKRLIAAIASVVESESDSIVAGVDLVIKLNDAINGIAR